MFFDENGPAAFDREKIRIARLQQELLRMRYDPERREPRALPVKRTGLFGREPALPEGYRQKALRLRESQRALEDACVRAGYPRGVYWWNLPWERTAPVLLQALTAPAEEAAPDEDGWRRAVTFLCQAGRQDRQLLALILRSHHQATDAFRKVRQIEHSAYTQAEREAMVSAWNDRRNQAALLHTAFANQVGVHSAVTGWDYDTAFDYYTSAEYLSHRLRESEGYSQSLYTVEKRSTLYVSSESRDLVGVHGLCEFHLDSAGRLDQLTGLGFALLEGEEGPAGWRETRDALVLAAWLLAERPEVRGVPLALFEQPGSESDPLQLAGVLTCLAEKLEGGENE